MKVREVRKVRQVTKQRGKRDTFLTYLTFQENDTLTQSTSFASPSIFSTVFEGSLTNGCVSSAFSSLNFLSLPSIIFSRISGGFLSFFICSFQISFSFVTISCGTSLGRR